MYVCKQKSEDYMLFRVAEVIAYNSIFGRGQLLTSPISEQHMPPENFEMYVKNEDYMLFRVVEVIA